MYYQIIQYSIAEPPSIRIALNTMARVPVMDIEKLASVQALRVAMGVWRPVCASAPEIQLPAFLCILGVPHINVWYRYVSHSLIQNFEHTGFGMPEI